MRPALIKRYFESFFHEMKRLRSSIDAARVVCGACLKEQGNRLCSGPPLCDKCLRKVSKELDKGGTSSRTCHNLTRNSTLDLSQLNPNFTFKQGGIYTCSSITRREDVIYAEPLSLSKCLKHCYRTLSTSSLPNEVISTSAELAHELLPTSTSLKIVVWAGAGLTLSTGLCPILPTLPR
jgi:hypothetical protein